MARIGRGELAQSLYDGHCSVRRADLLCEAEMRDVTRLCVDSESFCGLDQ
jgi:hypothetical protein